MPCCRKPAGSRPTCWPRLTPSATSSARRSRRRHHHAPRLEAGLPRLGRRRLERGVTAGAMGGQGLPHALNAACIEMWNSASMAFGIGPVLTMGAAEALANYGTEELKQRYLPKLVSGEWMGTMQLTEPQAGSDVGALRTKAVREQDGTYRITGRRSSSPTASTISPTTSSTSCWRGCPTRRPATGAFRCFWCPRCSSARTALFASITTCAPIPSSTSSGFTPPDLHHGVRG